MFSQKKRSQPATPKKTTDSVASDIIQILSKN